MEMEGMAYSDAVRQAQQLGYAEADPSMDVDGSDAAQKLAILSQLAFGVRIAWRGIPRRGIDRLELADLQYAKELGYRIKLLAIAQLTPDGLETHVSPTLVKLTSPLADVRGAHNAVSVVGDAVGRVSFSGLGAGQMPTASAVVADMIDVAVGRAAITFRRLELWSNERTVSESDYANVAARSAGRAGGNRRRAWRPSDLDRLGDSARGRRGARVGRATDHHDPSNDRRRREPGDEKDRSARIPSRTERANAGIELKNRPNAGGSW
jgi:hypothetical protein